MRLGAQTVAFLAFDPPGAPYPDTPCATDPVFQHLAIPVRAMETAFVQLSTLSPGAISLGGPQALPKTSGGVTAYKFRDPDGHPLELIAFPDGPPAERWKAVPGLFLGIDHSAITVTDRDAALAFYADLLGFRVVQRGLNSGGGPGAPRRRPKSRGRRDRVGTRRTRDPAPGTAALPPARDGPADTDALRPARPGDDAVRSRGGRRRRDGRCDPAGWFPRCGSRPMAARPMPRGRTGTDCGSSAPTERLGQSRIPPVIDCAQANSFERLRIMA